MRKVSSSGAGQGGIRLGTRTASTAPIPLSFPTVATQHSQSRIGKTAMTIEVWGLVRNVERRQSLETRAWAVPRTINCLL